MSLVLATIIISTTLPLLKRSSLILLQNPPAHIDKNDIVCELMKVHKSFGRNDRFYTCGNRTNCAIPLRFPASLVRHRFNIYAMCIALELCRGDWHCKFVTRFGQGRSQPRGKNISGGAKYLSSFLKFEVKNRRNSAEKHNIGCLLLLCYLSK